MKENLVLFSVASESSDLKHHTFPFTHIGKSYRQVHHFQIRRYCFLGSSITNICDNRTKVRYLPFTLDSIFFSPLLRQPPGRGRSQHGLAEAFEYLRDVVQVGLARIYPRQQGIEFIGDVFLFGSGAIGISRFRKSPFWLTGCLC